MRPEPGSERFTIQGNRQQDGRPMAACGASPLARREPQLPVLRRTRKAQLRRQPWETGENGVFAQGLELEARRLAASSLKPQVWRPQKTRQHTASASAVNTQEKGTGICAD